MSSWNKHLDPRRQTQWRPTDHSFIQDGVPAWHPSTPVLKHAAQCQEYLCLSPRAPQALVWGEGFQLSREGAPAQALLWGLRRRKGNL